MSVIDDGIHSVAMYKCDSANHCPKGLKAICVFADFSCNFGEP